MAEPSSGGGGEPGGGGGKMIMLDRGRLERFRAAFSRSPLACIEAIGSARKLAMHS